MKKKYMIHVITMFTFHFQLKPSRKYKTKLGKNIGICSVNNFYYLKYQSKGSSAVKE